jgi:hypothetical protein
VGLQIALADAGAMSLVQGFMYFFGGKERGQLRLADVVGACQPVTL